MKPVAQFESIVKAVEAKTVILHPPGNHYELQFSLDGGIEPGMLGNRILGTAHANALKVHQASGGGAFIEPLQGEPRIVAGRVIRCDEDGVVLVRSAIPLLIRVEQESDLAKCRLGEFINFHVESGMVFRPCVPE